MPFVKSIAARAFALAGAALLTTLGFTASLAPTPAAARSQSGVQIAQLAAPTEREQVIVRGTAWKCDGSTCVAVAGTSRDWIACRRLAEEVGTITAFRSRDETLGADKLARCND